MHIKRMLLPLLLALCLTAAFAEGSDLPRFEWERNGSQHWHVSADGTKTDVDGHQLTGARCSICGSEVWAFDDGASDVSDYNEQGDLVRYTSFAEDGTVNLELFYTYEYDAQGRMLLSREYTGDELTEEMAYVITDSGLSVPAQQLTWYADSSWDLHEYDLNGNLVHTASFDPNGDVTHEEFSEYASAADGMNYEAKRTALYADGTSQITEYSAQGLTIRDTEMYVDGASIVTLYNEQGDPISVTTYNAEEQAEAVQTYEYEYAEDGAKRLCLAYMDGALVIRTEYASNEYGYVTPAKETVYSEDGLYTVFTFDEYGEVLSESTFAAGGAPIQ